MALAKAYGIQIWYNSEQFPEGTDLLQGIANLNLETLNICGLFINEELLKQAEKLSVWTIDEEEHLPYFLKAGVHNITTHNPFWL